MMKLYLAPLEGITTHTYRNVMEKYFPGADRYFTPFIAPDQNRVLRTKETRDILPEHNHVPELIPQVLTNNPDHFVATAEKLSEYGYTEVNLNFGCPSGTVVTRKRGSGILAFPDELDQFLEEIFMRTKIRISVKTRIGRYTEEEAAALARVYARYPFSELIIHPRTQQEFYRPVPNQTLYTRYQTLCEAIGKCSYCYNGNLLSEELFRDFAEKFPDTVSVMIGRGAIANPGLLHQIRTGKPMEKDTFLKFHDEIAGEYLQTYSEERNTLHRMKEMWIYMQHSFADCEKYMKKIRKVQSYEEYRFIVENLVREQEIIPEGPAKWKLPSR